MHEASAALDSAALLPQLQVWPGRPSLLHMHAQTVTTRLPCLQVVLHIARRVADLHAAGYAHRDLKPSNTMWLARENKWTLIDFGCAARIGTDAPLIYSLGYAPPEVVAADRAGVRAIPVTAALDCWAVGVVVMELFAGRCIFSMSRGKEEVCCPAATYANARRHGARPETTLLRGRCMSRHACTGCIATGGAAGGAFVRSHSSAGVTGPTPVG